MPTYCTLADAYGPGWGVQPNQNESKTVEIANKKREEEYNKRIEKAQTAPKGETISTQNGMDSNCPNCKHCLRQNNEFQQRVIDQSINPLPRWVPQTSNTQAWDPFNRYFAPKEQFGNIPFHNTMGFEQFNPFQRREDFGNISTANASHLIQLVLYLLIALFVIQLLELLGSLTQ